MEIALLRFQELLLKVVVVYRGLLWANACVYVRVRDMYVDNGDTCHRRPMKVRGQKAARWSRLSPCTFSWLSRMELELPNLGSKYFLPTGAILPALCRGF